MPPQTIFLCSPAHYSPAPPPRRQPRTLLLRRTRGCTMLVSNWAALPLPRGPGAWENLPLTAFAIPDETLSGRSLNPTVNRASLRHQAGRGSASLTGRPPRVGRGWDGDGDSGGTLECSLPLCAGAPGTGLGTNNALLRLPAVPSGTALPPAPPVPGSVPAEGGTWRERWLPPTRRSPWHPRSSAPASSGSRG